MKHDKLMKILEELEGRVSWQNPPQTIEEVCQPAVQAYVLDKSNGAPPENEDFPIIIAVGANYTQASATEDIKEKIPRKEFECEVLDRTNCRQKMDNALEYFSKLAKYKVAGEWSDYFIAGETTGERVSIDMFWNKELTVVRPYHFVMTNFSPWITKNSWQDIIERKRVNVLLNPPQWDGKNVPSGEWPHMDALVGKMREANMFEKTLWVGHGINSTEILLLFRLFVQKHGINQWMILPNLSSHYHRFSKK